MGNRLVKPFFWVICFQVIGAFLGFVTRENIHPWYDDLAKTSLTPPAIIFSIVWPILYITLAISGYLLWQNRHNVRFKKVSYCFMVQMLMNWAWTPIFFIATQLIWHCFVCS